MALRVVSSCKPQAAPLVEHAAQTEAGAASSLGGAVTPPETSQIDTSYPGAQRILSGYPPPVSETGCFLCDRMTVVIPVALPHDLRPEIGLMWLVGPEGWVEGFRHRRRMVEGSWTSKVSIEVHDSAVFDADLARDVHAMGLDLVWFRIDGNAVKWFQGWNVFGSANLAALVETFCAAVLDRIGLGPASGAVPLVRRGYFNRLDATYNFDLGDASAAASLVRQIGKLATVSHRRSSTFAGSMVFPGRRSSLCIYHKGPEMIAHPPVREIPGLVEYAHRIVRFEVVSRSECLEEFGYRKVSGWDYDNSVSRLFDLWLSFVSRMRFPVMSDVDVSILTPAARRLYGVWLAGHDVHAFASRMTVYRHRLAVLNAGGPDIALPKPEGDVIQFRRVLTPVPAVVPPQFDCLMYRPRAA